MTAGRARLAGLLVFLALVGVGVAWMVSGEDAYVLKAQFRVAGGLRQGFKVRIDGVPVGKIGKLSLDSHDRVVAELEIDKSAAPVGRDVRATARAADLLGEKFVDVQPGNRRRPAPSGTVIPPARTAISVELDDVVNAVDLPVRRALATFINEQGAAYVGRGGDIAATLATLPRTLDRTGKLLDEFASDTRALGNLIDESDRVVASVARERGSLGRFVGAFGETLDVIASRRAALGETVRRAPAALVATRRALTALEGAAIPLAPAARGLRATAPQLTATLNQRPQFADSARPTLHTIRRVSPTLGTLGRRGTPVVRHLRPLASELATFSAAADPVTRTLDTGAADILGVLEGWARATQAHDGASHIFRFGLTVAPAAIANLFPSFASKPRRSAARAPAAAAPKSPAGSVPGAPAGQAPAPGAPAPSSDLNRINQEKLSQLRKALQALPNGAAQDQNRGVQPLLDYLLSP
ncbi:MAG: phospholipid/cholesterol/gamma-HCH transport system substrate-binding protein [Candidatus Eremiobacteraeota bacterium]|nr:phospholipid/cholesterol/gamma-HCH transport system substrate-binding protein [Candidatus Eremiobacteraeota bacterium]